MNPKQNCSGCIESDRCMSADEQAGKVQGPSVVGKVTLAFLLPIIIFIVVLAVSENWLLTSLDNEKIRTGIGVLLALGVDLTYILLLVKFKRVRQKNMTHS
jgi:uncharacterized membrane protein (DUF485 family)